MPAYTWLVENKLNASQTKAKIRALRTLGVPYPKGYEKSQAIIDLKAQANEIAGSIEGAESDREVIAIIAYLQRLGTDIIVQDDSNEK